MIGMQRIAKMRAAVPMPSKQEQRMRRVLEMPQVSLSLRPRCCQRSNCRSCKVKSGSVVRGRFAAVAGLQPEVLTSLGGAGKSGTSGRVAVSAAGSGLMSLVDVALLEVAKLIETEAGAVTAPVVPNASLGRPRCP